MGAWADTAAFLRGGGGGPPCLLLQNQKQVKVEIPLPRHKGSGVEHGLRLVPQIAKFLHSPSPSSFMFVYHLWL